MGLINQKRVVEKNVESHLNWMGGNSFDMKDPLNTLRIAASSCFFGEPMYYHEDKADARPSRDAGRPSTLDSSQLSYLRETLEAIDPKEWRSMTPSQMMESAIDKALDSDPKGTLQLAVQLRNEGHMRTTPQVIMVRAAHHPKVRGTGLVKAYAPGIIKRADELTVQLAYQISSYGKSAAIPNSLKKAWAQALQKFDEYQLAKYRMEDRDVKLVDVVNLVHPKSSAVGKLVKGELKNSGKTWESIISAGGSTVGNWTEALEVMGHMALLRNIRNLLDKGVPADLFVQKLIDGAKKGQQFPFRYYSAFKAVEGKAPSSVLDAIEQCMELSLGKLPRLPGKLMALCDNSGSARGTTTSSMGSMQISTIANLTAILAAKLADDGEVGVFGDALDRMKVRAKQSTFDLLRSAEERGARVGEATENGVWLFWDDAIKSQVRYDNVFIFSDMQAGHGGLYGTDPRAYSQYTWGSSRGGDRYIDVAKLVKEYRRRVNPDVNVFLVQVAGYQDTLVPEFYRRTYILGGWGEGVLRFAAEMAKIAQK